MLIGKKNELVLGKKGKDNLKLSSQKKCGVNEADTCRRMVANDKGDRKYFQANRFFSGKENDRKWEKSKISSCIFSCTK